MTKHEKDEILRGLSTLAVAFDKEQSPERNLLYLENLKDCPVLTVLTGIKRAMKSCKFFPSIAEIRELAGQGDNKQALEDQAVLAWDRLRNGKKGRAYDPSALACPITKKCFQALGGANRTLTGFGMWDIDQDQWKRKEFVNLYTAHARNTRITQEFDQVESQGILQQITNHGLMRPS